MELNKSSQMLDPFSTKAKTSLNPEGRWENVLGNDDDPNSPKVLVSSHRRMIPDVPDYGHEQIDRTGTLRTYTCCGQERVSQVCGPFLHGLICEVFSKFRVVNGVREHPCFFRVAEYVIEIFSLPFTRPTSVAE